MTNPPNSLGDFNLAVATVTTQGMEAAEKLARLQQLVKTKDDIIAALRHQLAAQESLLRIYQELIGNGEEEANA
jgi:hypothetical protein